MGADRAVHVADDALHGTDALGTARVLAKTIASIDGVDLVLAGNEASDGRCGAVPAVVAEILGMPALTHGRELAVEGGSVTVVRETDDGVTVISAELPAVITVNEKVNEPRYPSFKGIMAAKKKPVTSLTLADLEIDVATVGLPGMVRRHRGDAEATQVRGREGAGRRRWRVADRRVPGRPEVDLRRPEMTEFSSSSTTSMGRSRRAPPSCWSSPGGWARRRPSSSAKSVLRRRWRPSSPRTAPPRCTAPKPTRPRSSPRAWRCSSRWSRRRRPSPC